MTRFEYELWGAKATCLRGNDLPHAKLNPEKVREIRTNKYGLSAQSLAYKYGVHVRTIDAVRTRQNWNHI